jgi:hypothetical protein|tara:strand:+ start:1418 stop:1966 length:549 start_codon:yes stop_codon:yes gene_type:complete
MTYKIREGRMGATKLEEYDDDGEYVRLVAEFFYDNDAAAVRDALNSGNVKFPAPHKKIIKQVIKEHWGALNRLEDNDYWRHKKENCVVYQEGGLPCPDCDEEPTVSKTETVAICDGCGRETKEHETISTPTLAGVVMCGGSMKESCRDISTARIDDQIAWLKKLAVVKRNKIEAARLEQEEE